MGMIDGDEWDMRFIKEEMKQRRAWKDKVWKRFLRRYKNKHKINWKP